MFRYDELPLAELPERCYSEGPIRGELDVDYVIVNDNDPDLVPVAIPIPEYAYTKSDYERCSMFMANTDPENQYWKMYDLPEHIRMLNESCKDSIEFNKRCTPEDKKFIAREMQRLKYGHWFPNNGKPTYITGAHYFFLQYWRNSNNGKTLSYRKPNREFFLMWEWISKHELHEGITWFTKRRGGKTEVCSSILYYRTITNANHYSGMQSKTEPDAEKIFDKIVEQWRSTMPLYLKPISSVSSDKPGKVLPFDKPRERTGKTSVYRKYKVLNSKLDFQSSAAVAYDGQELNTYYGDEFSKTLNVNVYERHEVIRKTFRDSEDVLVGKALYTTTMEYLDKDAGQQALNIFNDSSISTMVDEALQTTHTGLFVYFCPAHQCTVFDKYGNPDERLAIDRLMAKRKGKDGKALSSEKRKNPMNIAEAFIGDAYDCHFDIEMIQNQKMQNRRVVNKDKTIRGNLHRVDNEEDGEVYFKPSESGKFLIHRMPRDPNAFKISDATFRTPSGKIVNHKMLKATVDYAAGTDPFDHRKDVMSVNSNRKSNGAGHVIDLSDAIDVPKDSLDFENRFDEKFQEGFKYVCQYVARPDDPNEYYEDMIMMCCFYGCQILVESQKSGAINYFYERGYSRFIALRPKSTLNPKQISKNRDKGMPTNERTMAVGFDYMIDYVNNHIHKIWFEDLLNDLEFMNIKARLKFDVGVSAIITLMHAMDIVEKYKEKQKKKTSKPPAYGVKRKNSHQRKLSVHDDSKNRRAAY